MYDSAGTRKGRRKSNMRKKMNPVVGYLLIVAIAVLGALNYEIFIFPNNFASAGLNGILTIIRHLTGFNFGYMSLILNLPLLLIAFKVLHRHFAINTLDRKSVV